MNCKLELTFPVSRFAFRIPYFDLGYFGFRISCLTFHNSQYLFPLSTFPISDFMFQLYHFDFLISHFRFRFPTFQVDVCNCTFHTSTFPFPISHFQFSNSHANGTRLLKPGEPFGRTPGEPSGPADGTRLLSY